MLCALHSMHLILYNTFYASHSMHCILCILFFSPVFGTFTTDPVWKIGFGKGQPDEARLEWYVQYSHNYWQPLYLNRKRIKGLNHKLPSKKQKYEDKSQIFYNDDNYKCYICGKVSFQTVATKNSTHTDQVCNCENTWSENPDNSTRIYQIYKSTGLIYY
jgi:hypothetical protein